MTEETEKMPIPCGAGDAGEVAENSAADAEEAAKDSAGETASLAASETENGFGEAGTETAAGDAGEVAREAAEEALPELLRRKIARLEERLAGLEAGMGRVAEAAVGVPRSEHTEFLGVTAGVPRNEHAEFWGSPAKGHLSSVVPAMGRDETLSVPRAEMAMLRDCFPDKTDSQIAELYRETIA